MNRLIPKKSSLSFTTCAESQNCSKLVQFQLSILNIAILHKMWRYHIGSQTLCKISAGVAAYIRQYVGPHLHGSMRSNTQSREVSQSWHNNHLSFWFIKIRHSFKVSIMCQETRRSFKVSLLDSTKCFSLLYFNNKMCRNIQNGIYSYALT